MAETAPNERAYTGTMSVDDMRRGHLRIQPPLPRGAFTIAFGAWHDIEAVANDSEYELAHRSLDTSDLSVAINARLALKNRSKAVIKALAEDAGIMVELDGHIDDPNGFFDTSQELKARTSVK